MAHLFPRQQVGGGRRSRARRAVRHGVVARRGVAPAEQEQLRLAPAILHARDISMSNGGVRTIRIGACVAVDHQRG